MEFGRRRSARQRAARDRRSPGRRGAFNPAFDSFGWRTSIHTECQHPPFNSECGSAPFNNTFTAGGGCAVR